MERIVRGVGGGRIRGGLGFVEDCDRVGWIVADWEILRLEGGL